MMLSTLVMRLNDTALLETNVIPWSSPVPSFGDLATAKIATLGLNPSNREFMDESGKELDGPARRLHTLGSLGLSRWSDADERHFELIMCSCREYFSRNPYDGWFRRLDFLISGTKASYYGSTPKACHLDLIPYATTCKWTELTSMQRADLLAVAGDTLGLLLKDSPVEILVLNGNSVIEQFQDIANVRLEKQAMEDWSLPRRSGLPVTGFAYTGVVRNLSGVELERDILALGFNHNIQSSFGVTKQVITAIRQWIAETTQNVIA
ncbi:MAG: hypothetical protein ABSE16_14725 [Verrucomicrobiota bacterium]|jgi:hypothetical protein